MFSNENKLILAILFALASLTFGIMIFVFIEDHNLVDALYMTAITVSTVGFGTMTELSQLGKIFISIYIFFNIGVFTFVLSIISTYIFEGELNKMYNDYVGLKKIKKMKNHVIVIGYGRNGMRACEELHEQLIDFVIIDTDEERKSFNSAHDSFHFILGEATSDETLLNAGIKEAKAIICTLPSDAENVYITLTAKQLNPKIVVISRASEATSELKMQRAGADHVVMPDHLGGLHMARLIAKPYVVKFLEMLNGAEESVEVDEFSYDDFNFAYKGKTLRDLKVRQRTGVSIIGYKSSSGTFRFNPNAEHVVSQGDILILLGTPEQIEAFNKKFS